jgi:flagellar protein FliS
MVAANAYQRYKEQEVGTANPAVLIVMLYNGCIKRLKLAQIEIDKKNYEAVNKHLQKAQDILMELINSLDFRYPVAKDLMALYEFMLHEILQINASKNKDRIDPVLQMLSSLRDAWAQAEKTCRPSYELSESE